jgi:hypothetical protein
VPDIELMTSPTEQGMYYSIMNSYFPSFEHAYYPEGYYYQEVMNMKEHGMTTAYVFNPEFDGYVDGNGDVIYNLDPIAPFVEATELAGFDSIIWNMTIAPILRGLWMRTLREVGRNRDSRTAMKPTCARPITKSA